VTIDAATREHVRQRANYACEYCGVSETDTGGLLTIDHFQPVSKGGSNSLENLLYCCVRCNQYKMNYWPAGENDPHLWYPRTDSAADRTATLYGTSYESLKK
jgi:5-methylcytosine-specific restriction endonuclease McrA